MAKLTSATQKKIKTRRKDKYFNKNILNNVSIKRQKDDL